ncbi:MAG: hypothetical protein PHC95_07170 [Parabacteroides sp.]|nr:hypothetical protein [Parabacteroides sp.]
MEGIIKNYLSGTRLYMEGVAIYEKFGNNVALKRAFRINSENRILRMTLFEELRKLAGLTEAEFNNLSRNVKPSTGLKNTDEHTPVTTRNKRTINPGEAKRIRFRERFTFLNSTDCPDVLKVLVNDMFTSYDAYRTAHNTLAFMPPDAPMEETSLLAEAAVEEMLNDRMIWTELQHYQEHKTLLGNHPDVKDYLKWKEYREMSDFDLMQRRKNAASNISKYKAKIEEDTSEEDRLKHETSMREWIMVKQICDHEIEHRKKGK